MIWFFKAQRIALILDSLESLWETAETRPEIESIAVSFGGDQDFDIIGYHM